MDRFKFPNELRLMKRTHFSFVLKHPKQISASQLFIFSRINLLKYPRIGLIVAKKNVKLAHDRNRIKRLIRESFRLHQYILPAMDFVVIIRKGVEDISNCILTEVLEKLWHRHCHSLHGF